MSESRLRRIDARPATPEVLEYRELVARAHDPPADTVERAAAELVQLCRYRSRPAILRQNLRFGRSLAAIRVSDLDGDGVNEMLVVDNERTVHALLFQPGLPAQPPPAPFAPGLSDGAWLGPAWYVGTHRYRGRLLGLTFTGFGVFRRQEAVITSVEEHSEGERYHELKLTCDGQTWDKAELLHRGGLPGPTSIPPRAPVPRQGEVRGMLAALGITTTHTTEDTVDVVESKATPAVGGFLRLIGESCEPGRVPVLRARESQHWVELLDDRTARSADGSSATLRVQLPPGEVTALCLCDHDIVVAFAHGGLLRISLAQGTEGMLYPPLFPEWRFSCLSYASGRMLGDPGGQGLLCGGTTFGYVFAIDLSRSGVLWRLDAGFLFSAIALGDFESSGRCDLALGGSDGGLRIYELTDSQLIERRSVACFTALGSAGPAELLRQAPPGTDAHAAVQLFLLSRILESRGSSQTALVELVSWFTAGRPGWHQLPERAQRDAGALLERFLLSALPAVAGEQRSTATGPLPIVMLGMDPKMGAVLTRTILAELVDVYLAAPRLVRRQIDRISRRLIEQYWRLWQPEAASMATSVEGGAALLPELTRLLNVRGLRAREYAHALMVDAEETLQRYAALPAALRPVVGEESEVLMRILRAMGLLEEAYLDHFSMETERLDLALSLLEPLPCPPKLPELEPDAPRPPLQCWVNHNGSLRVESVPEQAQGPGIGSTLSPSGAVLTQAVEAGSGPLGRRDGALTQSSWPAVLPGTLGVGTLSTPRPPVLGDAAALPSPALAGRMPYMHETYLGGGTPCFLLSHDIVSAGEAAAAAGEAEISSKIFISRSAAVPEPRPLRGPALLLGQTERAGTQLRLYVLSESGVPELLSTAWAPLGAEPIGYDRESRLGSAVEGRESRLGSAVEGRESRLGAAVEGRESRLGSAVVDQQQAEGPREVILLRVPAQASGAGDAGGVVLAVDAPGGVLRVREHRYPADLVAATSGPSGASVHVAASRVSLRTPAGRALSTPAPAACRCCALSPDGLLLAVGTMAGLVQVYQVAAAPAPGGRSTTEVLRLKSQHLLHKGVSALCFLPTDIFGVAALAVGTEDEQVHIFAADEGREGQELARLSVGGTPLRLLCLPLSAYLPAPPAGAEAAPRDPRGGSYRLAMLLHGGVVAYWDTQPVSEAAQAIRHLLDLAARAAGSHHRALAAALHAPGPHTRAVAMAAVLREAREHDERAARGAAEGRVTSSEPRGAAAEGREARRSVTGVREALEARGSATAVLSLARQLLWNGAAVSRSVPPPLPLPGTLGTLQSSGALQRVERSPIVLRVLCEALLPLALGLTPGRDEAHSHKEARAARDLIQRAVQQCEDPLVVRADLLVLVERLVKPEHLRDLMTWLPNLILTDPRSAIWPFAIDSVAALLLQHLKRLCRARLFDSQEEIIFRNVAKVLDAVQPSQPSKLLLAEVALLLRAALPWDRLTWAGDLGRVRLHLPHVVVDALCQAALLPDPEARAFLSSVSKRWTPRLPMLGGEDPGELTSTLTLSSLSSFAFPGAEGEGHAQAGVLTVGEQDLTWWLSTAVEMGFDMLYYERLAQELTRFTRPAGPGEEEPDAWALADTVQAVLRLFNFGKTQSELVPTLQPAYAEVSLKALRSHRGQSRYRDQAWGFLDDAVYEEERIVLSLSLQQVDRKANKAQQVRALEQCAHQLNERRERLMAQLRARLLAPVVTPPEPSPLSPAGEGRAAAPPGGEGPRSGGEAALLEEGAPPPLLGVGGYEERLLLVRPAATVVALMSGWQQVLNEEVTRLATEADFEVRLAADLGVTDGRRTLRYAVRVAPYTNRGFPRAVQLSVRSTEPAEVQARPTQSEPVDLELGRELSLLVEAPAHLAAAGLSYRIELEIGHDDGKRTERLIDGQFTRDAQPPMRGLLHSFAEQLPTAYARAAQKLTELLEPGAASVILTTAFPSHAYELLSEVVGLEWPDRPVDSSGSWRMVNLAARPASGAAAGGAVFGGSAAAASAGALRDLLQLCATRIGQALGLQGAERLDTVEALVRAVQGAPLMPGVTSSSASLGKGQSRGLLILGLPELAARSRLEDADLRQLLALGARVCQAYRGRALIVLSPAATALSLGQGGAAAGLPPGEGREAREEGTPAKEPELEILDLDQIADPYSTSRQDDKARLELARTLTVMLGGAPESAEEEEPERAERPERSDRSDRSERDERAGKDGRGEGRGVPALGAGQQQALQQAVHALLDATGADLRLLAEFLPLSEQALRERARAPLGVAAFEGRVGLFLQPVWDALPLSHRLYLAALASDTVELDVGDLKVGLVLDAAVHSISGKDRLPTSKVVVAGGVRLDARAIEDLSKVMWLRKARVRGSLQDSRTVLWTYLRQPRPRGAAGRGGERWLEQTAQDLKRLGLLRSLKLPGDRHLYAFTSPAAREWLRALLGLGEGEAGLPSTPDGRNLVRALPLWDAAAVDKTLGGNSAPLRAVLGFSRTAVAASGRWAEFLELSRACRKWADEKEEPRFIKAIADYFKLDLVEGSARDIRQGAAEVLRCTQVRFRDQRQIPWLKRVVLYLPAGQPDRSALAAVQKDLRARMAVSSGSGGLSGPFTPRPDSAYSGADGVISDTTLSAIVVVPELSADVATWSRTLFHVAAIDVADLQHAALHESPVEELIRRLAAAASYAALSPFRSKMGLANQELIEEMFYGRRGLLEEIRGQRQENFTIVGPRKIGKTSLLQRVRLELEQQGYRVIPRGMDYTTSPSSRDLLRAMLSDLLDDLEPAKAGGGHFSPGAHFGIADPLPALRQVVDQWAQRFPDRSIAIVLDEIDTILRSERRAYLLGEWREAAVLGEALQSLLPTGVSLVNNKDALSGVHAALSQAGFPRDVVDGVVKGLVVPPSQRRQSPLLEELRSASALVLRGSAVCRVILAGHAELAEARSDLFGPLLNFAKLRYLDVLDSPSAERMVREPFARLGLRFENAAAEQQLLQQTFRVPAWIQYCGALIIQSIDERLRTSRRDEQKITERDVQLALERVHAEERSALMSENGLYMLGPECSFLLLTLVDEGWFTIDEAVEFLKVWYDLLDPIQRKRVDTNERDFGLAFSPEAVRRMVRDLTNTFYLISDEMVGQGMGSSPPSAQTPAGGAAGRPGRPAGREGRAAAPGRDVRSGGAVVEPQGRFRRSYRVQAAMVRTVFREELTLQKRVELAKWGMRLWAEGRGVWARISGK